MNVVLPFSLIRGGVMEKKQNRNEEKKPRSVVLPAYIWEALERDAARCHRTVTKQIEAIFSRYYKLDTGIELDETSLEDTYHAVSQRRMKA